MNDDLGRAADAYALKVKTSEGFTDWIEPDVVRAFIAGAAWQLAQLRCKTCAHWGDALNCKRSVVVENNNIQDFGCIFWRRKQ